MSIKIKTIAAAAVIATATIAGASTANAKAFNGAAVQTLQTETAQKGANAGAGVQQARYWGHRRCFRVPVYRWRMTPFGWRRVFVGFRIKCRRPHWHHRHHGPRFRIHLSF